MFIWIVVRLFFVKSITFYTHTSHHSTSDNLWVQTSVAHSTVAILSCRKNSLHYGSRTAPHFCRLSQSEIRWARQCICFTLNLIGDKLSQRSKPWTTSPIRLEQKLNIGKVELIRVTCACTDRLLLVGRLVGRLRLRLLAEEMKSVLISFGPRQDSIHASSALT